MTLPETGLPLDDTDLDRLEQLLLDRVVPNEGMSLEILDGFLSALVVSPESVPAAEYLPAVWGNRAPAWTAPTERAEAETLVERLRLHVLWRVQREPAEVGEGAWPFLVLPPDGEEGTAEWLDFPAGAGWAVGFLHGMSLREAAWSRRMDDNEDVADDVATLFALTRFAPGEDDGDDAEADAADDGTDGGEETLLDLDQRLDIVAEIPALLHELHCLRIHELRPLPARREALPGRNDDCPCGSGRKYKKCCGATA